MSADTVRIYIDGPGGPNFREVDRSEVPPGYMPVQLVGHGNCFIRRDKLKTSDALLHPEFPDSIRAIMARFSALFDGAYTKTPQEWEDGFRADAHPWAEIARWELLAEGFIRFTRHLAGNDSMTQQKRKDVLVTLLTWMDYAPDHGRARMRAFGTLTERRVNEIGDWLITPTHLRRIFERGRELAAILCTYLPGPDRVSIDALFGEGVEPNSSAAFDRNELIVCANVILGVDRDSEHEFLIYGRKLLERVAHGAEAVKARILRIEMDQDTDDLEKLVSLVDVLKGSHDYQPTA